MSNEALGRYGGSRPQASSRRHSQPPTSTPSSNFSYNSPLQSRTRMNDTTPTKPSPLSQMTLPDMHFGSDFSADDDIFFTPSRPPLDLNSFSRSLSEPISNVRRRTATNTHRQQQQRSMQAPTNQRAFANRPPTIGTNPNPRRPHAPSFASPSAAMQQYQQQQYRQQQYREQLFRQQQHQQNLLVQQQYHQQPQAPQQQPDLLTCNLCDARFTLCSESIPADDQGRAYCAKCVGMMSNRIVKEQKARIAEEEGNGDDDNNNNDNMPREIRDDDAVMAGDDVLNAAEGKGKTVAKDAVDEAAAPGASAEQIEEAWAFDFDDYEAGAAVVQLEPGNDGAWDNWAQMTGRDLAAENSAQMDAQK